MKRNDIEPLSTRDILKCALQNEKVAFEKYNAIGESMLGSRNFTTAKIFFEAANAEKGHFLKLQKALKRLYGITVTDSMPLPFSDACPADGGDNACLLDVGADIHEEDAITYMEEVERTAEKFYLEAAEKTDRMDMKVLFRMLASEEGRHARLVRRIARKGASRNSGKALERLIPKTMH